MVSIAIPFARPNMTHGEKERQALTEVFEWLTPKQRKAIDELALTMNSPKKIVRAAHFCCGMTGIRGYWVCRAVARYMLQKRFPGKFNFKD